MEIEVSLIPFSEVGTPPASIQAVERKLREGVTVKIGRQVIKDGQVQTKGSNHGQDIWYGSKVISRNHAELWAKDGQIYVRDVGSSSGTFLNKMRLSPSGKGSRPYPLKNGDLLQFGVDYKGKTEGCLPMTIDMFKAVLLKVAYADQWALIRKKQGNPARFQTALKNLLVATNPYASNTEEQDASNISTECCICIGSIGPYQALFISPCSHCFHYKCVSVILAQSAMFQCPMCRQVANLTASVSMESLNEMDVADATPVNAGSDSDISMVANSPHQIQPQLRAARLDDSRSGSRPGSPDSAQNTTFIQPTEKKSLGSKISSFLNRKAAPASTSGPSATAVITPTHREQPLDQVQENQSEIESDQNKIEQENYQ